MNPKLFRQSGSVRSLDYAVLFLLADTGATLRGGEVRSRDLVELEPGFRIEPLAGVLSGFYLTGAHLTSIGGE